MLSFLLFSSQSNPPPSPPYPFFSVSDFDHCYMHGDLQYNVDEDEVYWRRKKGGEELEWPHNSTHLLSQLAQCFTNAMVGPKSWLGGLFNRFGNRRNEKFLGYTLTPIQEQRLHRLQERLHIPFDETRPDHQAFHSFNIHIKALIKLWHIAFPNVVLTGLISEQWKDMGWQGPNPSTDFRGCGFISLENLLFFGQNFPASFHRLLLKEDGDRATWEYPFAVAGINVSFMLIQMLDLYSGVDDLFEKPKNLPGLNFLKLLGEDEEAFDVLYCVAFELMDAQWLAMHASYMEFNVLSLSRSLVAFTSCQTSFFLWNSKLNGKDALLEVLQVTRTQLQRELSLDDVHRIQDLPAYNLLYK
ncbi:ELMO domain-containing protein A-like isoform X1 [Gossypium australe]|uniref:ELMO domain-containing protein A-like isoform X1 n=1 Tax=Gossypium australe TaxID=47621 RepID=A0A5B6V0B0_9ROSI|nr:ELMO domain-containing protein A-like isoform X1 [Gossypium australe]